MIESLFLSYLLGVLLVLLGIASRKENSMQWSSGDECKNWQRCCSRRIHSLAAFLSNLVKEKFWLDRVTWIAGTVWAVVLGSCPWCWFQAWNNSLLMQCYSSFTIALAYHRGCYPKVIFGAVLGYCLVQNCGTLVMFLVEFLMHFSHLELVIVHYFFAWVSCPSFLFEFDFSLVSCVVGQCTLS